jgi:Do/DeqQ family serine protease
MMRRILTTMLALLMVMPVALAQSRVPNSKVEIQMSFAPVVKRTAPAVVNVYAQHMEKQAQGGLMDDPFFRRFFGDDSFGRPQERVANSLGSGVIVDARGYIVTNNHVIKDGTDIRVALSDKREFEAKLLLADERSDLAVLKIETGGESLPALAFADSDELEVGDLVLAIGNPFGVGQTVTSGIVSALARTQVGVTDYQFFIQTDAAINPGNSGGALVNMNGELVGINTAIYSRSGGSIGIGFSIPSNMVETVVQSAQSGSSVIKRPWMGVELQDVTPDLAESLNLARPEGTLITKLHPKSPLLVAGLRRGDVVLAVDGKAIESSREFGFRIGTAPIGDTRIIDYRRGTQNLVSRIKLIAAPETVSRDELTLQQGSPFEGVTVANLSPAVAEELALSADATGLVVVKPGEGPASQFFQRGDNIAIINGFAITSVADLRKLLQKQQPGWIIGIIRNGQKLRLRLG